MSSVAIVNTTPIRIAQAIGITLSSFAAGNAVCMSLFLIPTILSSPPTTLLQQWTTFFKFATKIQPPTAVLAGLAFFYLAYAPPINSTESMWWSYVTAGSLCVGIVPYTLVFIQGTNKRLLGMRDAEARVDGRSVGEMVDLWGALNWGRAVMLSVAAGVGVWATLV